MNPGSRSRRPIFSANRQRQHRPDYLLLLSGIVLLAVGLIVVYAIGPALSVQKHVSENYYVSKQFIAIILGVIAFMVMSQTPVTWWKRVERPLIISAAVAALIVQLFGDQVNGAYRWIQIGGFSFQAVELIKFALLVWLAGFLSDRIEHSEISSYQKTFKPLLIVILIIGVVVAKMQSDLGSTGVMVAMITLMVFVAGFPLKRIAMIGGIIAIGTLLAVSSTGYRRQRLASYLHPERDCQAAGYQACQALISVGSGGMFGLGLSKSVQAYGYVPEAANDSIFAIYAEKFGFIGVLVLLGLYSAFFGRLLRVLERTTTTYHRLLIAGILAWLTTQTIINIGAMIGLLPLKGITLPFISYGGTSVVFVMAILGMAFQISRYTSYSTPNISKTEGRSGDDSVDRRRVRGAYYPNLGRRS